MIHELQTRSIDFVIAFPQADIDVDIYMQLPIGMEADDTPGRYFLKLNKLLYGLKQALHNFYSHLTKGLESRGFVPSKLGPCVYYRDDAIVMVYVDDCHILSKEQETIVELIESLKNGPEKYK